MPGTWFWGIALLRFAGPVGWGLAAIPFIAWIPAFQAGMSRRLAAAGDQLARSPRVAAAVAAVLVSAIVLALPDRSHFVGDYLLRFGPLSKGQWNANLFPQVMPLDPWFHFRLPTMLAPILHQDPATVDRWTSVLKASLVAISGVVLTAGLGLRGIAALTCWCVLAFTGSLAIFGGYSKGFVELTSFTAVFAACGVHALNRGKGLATATVAMALALATHRAAALLVPEWLLLMGWCAREAMKPSGAGRWEFLGAALTGAVAIAWSAPRILTIVAAIDRPHFLPGGGTVLKSLAVTVAPLRLLDLVNAFLLVCPALPLLAVIEFRRPHESRAIQWLAVLAVLHAAAVCLVHPKQGLFRDWDTASASGVAISCWVAAVLGITLSRDRKLERAGAPIIAVAVTSTLIWMSVNASLPRTVTRVVTYVSEPPPKAAAPLGLACRYLGLVYQDNDRPDAAERMFARASQLVPSESNMAMWAGLEVERGNLAHAQEIYRAIAKRSGSYDAYLALARCSAALGDSVETESAARRALEIRPSDERVSRLLDRLRHPDSQRSPEARR